MENRFTICAIGHGPQRLPWGYCPPEQVIDRMANWMIKMFNKHGKLHIISTMSAGIGMIWADATVRARARTPNGSITFEASVPYDNQASRWPEAVIAKYNSFLLAADKITEESKGIAYNAWLVHKNNTHMVDRSDYVVAFWDGNKKGKTHYCMCYARNKKKHIQIVPPGSLVENV